VLGLILFIRVLTVGFREVGVTRREAEEMDRPTEIMVWAFGVSLFAHVVSFWGTSYFDQTIVLWHFTLAMLASLHVFTQREDLKVEATEESEDPAELQNPLPAN
jgi:hypothetical protein